MIVSDIFFNIKSYYLQLLQWMKFADLSSTATILFGITAGLLSLIGIISVFLALNTQQRAYKAREIYWDIIGLSEVPEGTRMVNYIRQRLFFYKALTRKQFDITSIGISLTKHVVLSVILMWILFLIFWCFTLRNFDVLFVGLCVIVSSYLLHEFTKAIDKLSDILEVANLPSYDQILDSSFHKEEFKTIEIALRGSMSHLWRLADAEKIGLPRGMETIEQYTESMRSFFKEGKIKPGSELSAEIYEIRIVLPADFKGITVFFSIEYWKANIRYFCQKGSSCFSALNKDDLSICKIRFFIPYSIRDYEKIEILFDFNSIEGNAWANVTFNVDELLTMKAGLFEQKKILVGELVDFDEKYRKLFREH